LRRRNFLKWGRTLSTTGEIVFERSREEKSVKGPRYVLLGHGKLPSPRHALKRHRKSRSVKIAYFSSVG